MTPNIESAFKGSNAEVHLGNAGLYRWVGAWGLFKVNILCSECSLTLDVITDTFETEPAGVQARSPHRH